MKVTILTPTYNRAYTLKRLYDSLVKQTNKNFDWLIIDDGSIDNTKNLIDGFINENKIEIKYYYQKNGGKHRALNYGISLIQSELTFMVDSDDWIVENAVDIIINYGNKYKDYKNIGVLSFLKAYPDMSINGPKYEKNEYRGNYIEDRLNKKNWGDKAEVCYTKVLKKYPLLEIENEKFISEGYLWVKMAIEYDTIFINEIIYIADYLQDGLTRNIYKIRVKNPKGCIEVAKLACNNKANFRVKLKNMIKYTTYSIFDDRSFRIQFKEAPSRILFLLCLLPSVIFYLYVKVLKLKRNDV